MKSINRLSYLFLVIAVIAVIFFEDILPALFNELKGYILVGLLFIIGLTELLKRKSDK